MEVKLAQFGMGMQDGTVRHWFKAEGESIKRDEPLLEVEAAKTVVTIPAPCDGRLAKILVQVDENVPTQTVLAVLEPAGDNTAIEPSGSIGAQPSTAAPPERSAAPPHTAQLQVQVEPRARKLAQTLKVDLATVSGTGPNGRILEEDVHRAAVAPNLARYEDAPHSSTRRTIARRLTTSIQEIPHFYVAAQCEVDALLQARAHLNERGTAISLNDLIVRAAALALAATPDANVGWTDQSLRRYRSVDLGIAIATPHGVVAPVVRDADTKPLTTLAAELRDLSARARDARLQV
ncbi:MAG: dihydrolipoamide acetyltransferase family protein, partial [Steroidobacteraceae bacterium]